jgi:hypothetical protein
LPRFPDEEFGGVFGDWLQKHPLFYSLVERKPEVVIAQGEKCQRVVVHSLEGGENTMQNIFGVYWCNEAITGIIMGDC